MKNLLFKPHCRDLYRYNTYSIQVQHNKNKTFLPLGSHFSLFPAKFDSAVKPNTYSSTKWHKAHVYSIQPMPRAQI